MKWAEKLSYTFTRITLEVGEKQRRKTGTRKRSEMARACKKREYETKVNLN
jgi:hypothetical protein